MRCGIGEIVVKSEGVFKGYLDDEKNTKNILKNSWLYTGDLGKIDEEGFLFISGRKKNLIVLKNGKKVYPEELEDMINIIYGVKEALVYGVETGNFEYKICVDIVYDNSKFNMSEDKIHNYIKKEVNKINRILPKFKRISEIVISDVELEKNGAGKIKRIHSLLNIKKLKNLNNIKEKTNLKNI